MIKNFRIVAYLLFTVLASGSGHADESFIGTYGKIPNGRPFVKVTFDGSDYFVSFMNEGEWGEKHLVSEPDVQEMPIWFGENWEKKVESMLFTNDLGFHLVQLKSSYTFGPGLYLSDQVAYKGISLSLGTADRVKYVVAYWYFYHEVYKYE